MSFAAYHVPLLCYIMFHGISFPSRDIFERDWSNYGTISVKVGTWQAYYHSLIQSHLLDILFSLGTLVQANRESTVK